MKKFVTLLICLSFFVSCAGLNINPADLKGAHAQANFVNQTYLMALSDYSYYARLPNLTEEAKQLLRTKRIVLVSMIDQFYGSVVIFNRAVEGGALITEAGWNEMLNKLLELETGWYTSNTVESLEGMYIGSAEPKMLALDKEKNPDEAIMKLAQQASLVKEGERSQLLWEGILLELIRTGIHSIRALLAQRGMDEAALADAWQTSWGKIQAIDTAAIVTIP